MSLSAAQEGAVWRWVRAVIPSAWTDDAIKWVEQDHPKSGDRWCSIKDAGTESLHMQSEVFKAHMLQIVQLDFPADAATTITIDPQVDGASLLISTEGPSGSALLLRDAHLANLAGASLFWGAVATDPAGGDPGITITATELARGRWLNIAAGAPVVKTIVRDYQVDAVRDLEEVTVSIQVFSRLNDNAPDRTLHAKSIISDMRTRVFAPSYLSILRAGKCPPKRRTDIIDLTNLVRGSQWETRAQFSLILSRMSLVLDQTGTVESVSGTGVLQPGDLQVPFSASSED